MHSAATLHSASGGEGYPQIDALFRKTSDTAWGEMDLVYSVDTINTAADKNYTSFADYNI